MSSPSRAQSTILALLLTVLCCPPPASAVGAGCGSSSKFPGQLQVTLSFGGSEELYQHFYLDGPQVVTVYEGYAPGDRGPVLTGLTPGNYDLMHFVRYDDGSYPESTRRILSNCIVYGSVATPPPPPSSGGNDGATRLSVPALVGFPFSFAAELLAGFRNVDFVYADSTAPRRDVIAQSIRAGRLVDVETKLIVTLSSGMAPATPSDSPAASNPPASVEPTPSALVSPSVEILTSPSPTSGPAETAVAPPLTGSALPPPTGLFVLGAGLFTGLLILLAALRRRQRR